MFIDWDTVYNIVEFARYNELVHLKSANISMEWKLLEDDNNISHLVFNCGITIVFAHCHDNQTGNHIFVTQEDYKHV